jgi:adenine-specific DNA-methyltransferase
MARTPKKVDALKHAKARRINNPTAEMQSLAEQQEEMQPLPPLHFPRTGPLAQGETRERDADLDPQIVWNGVKINLTKKQVKQLNETGTVEISAAQLVWRGKDRQDWSDLVVNAPMLYVQEKLHPKQIIDDLKRQSDAARDAAAPDLFADFNGLNDPEARAEFYQHAMYWQNRMILGDSLQVMASLAGREALKGKVQCIYFDPPYGIKFNSNWQVSTQSRDVKDGKREDMSREPEQVKAFRDTWKDGIHSYLTYLRDRLTVAKELLAPSGSIFVQIGGENLHRVRMLLDEIFGADNCIETIAFRKKTMPLGGRLLEGICDYILWYARDKEKVKYRALYQNMEIEGDSHWNIVIEPGKYPRQMSKPEIADHNSLARDSDIAQLISLYPAGAFATGIYRFSYLGKEYFPPVGRSWKSPIEGMKRLANADRLYPYSGGETLRADSGHV